jgi:hypothetical protein
MEQNNTNFCISRSLNNVLYTLSDNKQRTEI